MEKEKFKNAYAYLYGYRIAVYKGNCISYPVLEELTYDGFTLNQLSRWRWYFRYRAALFQIKYPKYFVEYASFKYDITPEKEIEDLKNRLISRKRKLTNLKNKFKIIVDNWSEIFPIEDDIRYKNTVKKLDEIEAEIIEMQNHYDKLINS